MKGWVRARMPAIMVGLGVSQIGLGLWMAISPESFFDVLGGFGAENPHYVRDVSTFYLALGAALLVAVRRPTWRAPVLLVSALQYGIHSLNHLVDIGDAEPSWAGPLNAVTLVATVALFSYLFVVARDDA